MYELGHVRLQSALYNYLLSESLEDSENLLAPEIIPGEIIENQESALEQFGQIQ